MKERDDLLKAQQDRINHIFDSFEKGKEVPVGTVSTQGGVKMQKVAPGKWSPVSDKGTEKDAAHKPMHYRDMNKEQLHATAEKLGLKDHKDLGLKDLRSKVGDAVVTRNIQEGIAKMKSKPASTGSHTEIPKGDFADFVKNSPVVITTQDRGIDLFDSAKGAKAYVLDNDVYKMGSIDWDKTSNADEVTFKFDGGGSTVFDGFSKKVYRVTKKKK